jgi:protein TonB
VPDGDEAAGIELASALADMAHTVDILDERESLGGPIFFSFFLHAGIVLLAIGYTLYLNRSQTKIGDITLGRGVAVAVTPVDTIPIPRRRGPENPVANDTQSVIPPKPEKQETVQRKPEKAIPIPDKVKPKKQEDRAKRPQTYQQPTPQNQITTRLPQAAVNPMYSTNNGGNGVGISPNSVLGQRFGWYAEMIRKIIARNWSTNGLAGRQASAAVIGFTIGRDGSVRDIRLEQSSGNPTIDNSALRAVYSSNPLPALPPQYDRDTAPAEFTFDLR